MIPFWIWGAIYVIVKSAIAWYDSKTLDYTYDSFLLGYSPFSFFILWSGLNPTHALSTLWFLRSLFVIICLMPCISYLVYKYRWRWLLFSWCIYSGTKILGVYAPVNLKAFFEYGFSLSGLWAFSMGVYIRLFGFHLPKYSVFISAGFAFFFWSITWICVYHFNLKVRGGYLLPFFIPFCAHFIWTFIPTISIWKWLGKMSFPIYLMHNIFIESMEHISFMPMASSFIGYFLYWFLPIVFSILLATGMRMAFPTLASLMFGGR